MLVDVKEDEMRAAEDLDLKKEPKKRRKGEDSHESMQSTLNYTLGSAARAT